MREATKRAKRTMLPTAIALAASVLVGCPSPFGQPCGSLGECPEGYTCVADRPPGSRLAPICARGCERDADCGPGVNCRLSNNATDGSRFCNELGTLQMGEPCPGLNPLRECGPGLMCSFEGTCLPACNLDSPLVAERRCAPGTTCFARQRDFDDEMRAVSLDGACELECDPARNDQCQPTFLCRRWISPGIGETATCDSAEGVRRCVDRTTCPLGEICQDLACYAPRDAPPRRPEEWFPPLTEPTR
jgi:hypothetical protein